jgi:hypothetical protein
VRRTLRDQGGVVRTSSHKQTWDLHAGEVQTLHNTQLDVWNAPGVMPLGSYLAGFSPSSKQETGTETVAAKAHNNTRLISQYHLGNGPEHQGAKRSGTQLCVCRQVVTCLGLPCASCSRRQSDRHHKSGQRSCCAGYDCNTHDSSATLWSVMSVIVKGSRRCVLSGIPANLTNLRRGDENARSCNRQKVRQDYQRGADFECSMRVQCNEFRSIGIVELFTQVLAS